jgi:hypothetical protein
MKYFAVLLIFLLQSCSQKESGKQESNEQPSFDGMCGFLTRQEVESALGAELVETPAIIEEEYLGGKGCSYGGAKDNTEAHFGYVIFTTAEEFDKVRSGEKTAGVGDEAYTINGPDAQQLWVRQDNRYVMVAIGDAPRPEESKQLALLVLERLKNKPLNK